MLGYIAGLYNKEFGDFEAPIRFAIGYVCYAEDNFSGARYQWNKILKMYPLSTEAEEIKNIYNALDWMYYDLITDLEFREQYRFSKLFWNSKGPNTKMDINKLNNPVLALEYLEVLEKRYKEGNKKTLILYDIFLLIMGYNNDKIGFHNVSDLYLRSNNDPGIIGAKYHKKILENNFKNIKDKGSKKDLVQNYFLQKAEAISEKFKRIEGSLDYYIRTQFLLAVSTSGTKFISRKIDLREQSIPYLQNVISASKDNETNIYRLFSLMWLAELNEEADNQR